MKKIIISLFGCLFLFSNCSTVKFYNDSTLKTETGIKVYSAKPYLLVTSINDSLSTKIVYLPDLTNPQYIKLKSGLGTSNLSLTLTNGILTSYGLSTDTKIPETITAATGLLTGVASILKENTKNDKHPLNPINTKLQFKLYEFILDKDNTVILKKVEIIDKSQ